VKNIVETTGFCTFGDQSAISSHSQQLKPTGRRSQPSVQQYELQLAPGVSFQPAAHPLLAVRPP